MVYFNGTIITHGKRTVSGPQQDKKRSLGLDQLNAHFR